MKTQMIPSKSRGTANHGWLKSNFSFSFSHYYDPTRVHFGMLRVLNDDYIMGGGKFPTHPHDNMEIVTIPLTGAVEHKDNTGGQGIIQSGDIQIMSAGSGIQHSEANASETESLTLFQIWLFPKIKNIQPRYDQRTFDVANRLNTWQIVVSPREEDNALWINQDARFSLTNLTLGNTLSYSNAFKGNGVYLVVINGAVNINGVSVGRRDALGISEIDDFDITATEDAELLAIEIPMN
jgi:redox-sensitive bicupin YhaK (pirin superfamily)